MYSAGHESMNTRSYSYISGGGMFHCTVSTPSGRPSPLTWGGTHSFPRVHGRCTEDTVARCSRYTTSGSRKRDVSFIGQTETPRPHTSVLVVKLPLIGLEKMVESSALLRKVGAFHQAVVVSSWTYHSDDWCVDTTLCGELGGGGGNKKSSGDDGVLPVRMRPSGCTDTNMTITTTTSWPMGTRKPTVAWLFDTIPLDATNPSTLGRMLLLQRVPAQNRIRRLSFMNMEMVQHRFDIYDGTPDAVVEEASVFQNSLWDPSIQLVYRDCRVHVEALVQHLSKKFQ